MTRKTGIQTYVRGLLWAFVFTVHGVLVVAASWNHTFIPDESAYLNLAENLSKSGAYALDFASFWHAPGQPNTYYAPGWPALLAVGYSVGGMTGCWIVLWMVWCVASLLAHWFGRECGLSERWSWVLVACITVYPTYAYYHGHLMTEPITICFLLAVVGFGLRFVRRPTVGHCVVLAVVSAAGHLTRTQAVLPLVAVALLPATAMPWRRLLSLAAMFVLVHLAVLVPWLARMASVGANPSSVKLKLGINLFTYCGASGGDGYRPEVRPVPYPPNLENLTPSDRDRLLRQLAVAAIIDRPGDYLRTCVDRAGYLLSPTPNFTQAGFVQTIMLASATVLFVYVPLAAVLVALFKRRLFEDSGRLLLVTLCVWYTFHIAIHASIRQRLPSDILLMTLSLVLWTKQQLQGGGVSSMRAEPGAAADGGA